MKSHYKDYFEDDNYSDSHYEVYEEDPIDVDYFYNSDTCDSPVNNKIQNNKSIPKSVSKSVAVNISTKPAPWANIKNESVNLRKILEENNSLVKKETSEPQTQQYKDVPAEPHPNTGFNAAGGYSSTNRRIVPSRGTNLCSDNTKNPYTSQKDVKDHSQVLNRRLLWNHKNIKIEASESLENSAHPYENDRSKKTRFCLNIVDSGKCTRKTCAFAHTLAELSHPECRFTDACKKKNCTYKHPCESNEEFKIRTKFEIPKNIK